MKVFIKDEIHPAGFEKLRSVGVELIDDFDRLNEADGMIVRGVVATRELLQRATRLKVIGKHGAGYNTIDVEAARELGIRVVYTPGMNAQSVAELIASLMLDVSRHVSHSYHMVCNGTYDDTRKAALTGLELYGKIVAFIGLGNVSCRTAKLLRGGFDMTILGYDAYRTQADFDALGIQYFSDMGAMLRLADYVSLSVPLTAETCGMIGTKELRMMKPSAILINTSRGGIVDEEALYQALTEGWIAGAASDVFESEPPTAENRLFTLPNFVGTPHLGGSTQESIYRCTMTVVDDVIAVLNGQPPKYEVH